MNQRKMSDDRYCISVKCSELNGRLKATHPMRSDTFTMWITKRKMQTSLPGKQWQFQRDEFSLPTAYSKMVDVVNEEETRVQANLLEDRLKANGYTLLTYFVGGTKKRPYVEVKKPDGGAHCVYFTENNVHLMYTGKPAAQPVLTLEASTRLNPFYLILPDGTNIKPELPVFSAPNPIAPSLILKLSEVHGWIVDHFTINLVESRWVAHSQK